MWAFTNTTPAHGPLHYVKGSHTNDARKLRWLHERTRRLVNASAMPALAPTAAAHSGPFADATHGFEGSLRVEGFDPRHDQATARASIGASHLGFPPPSRALASPSDVTVVVADTSGFHYRGAAPGVPRQQIRLLTPSCKGRCKGETVGCGKGCVVRRGPFHCALYPRDC